MGCACMRFSGFGHGAEGFQKFQLRAQEAEGCKAFVEWRALGMWGCFCIGKGTTFGVWGKGPNRAFSLASRRPKLKKPRRFCNP